MLQWDTKEDCLTGVFGLPPGPCACNQQQAICEIDLSTWSGCLLPHGHACVVGCNHSILVHNWNNLQSMYVSQNFRVCMYWYHVKVLVQIAVNFWRKIQVHSGNCNYNLLCQPVFNCVKKLLNNTLSVSPWHIAWYFDKLQWPWHWVYLQIPGFCR